MPPWKNPQQNIDPSLHPNMYTYFPIINSIHKQWANLYNLKTFTLGMWGGGFHVIYNGIFTGFSTMVSKIAMSKFWSDVFGKKVRGKGVATLQYFWSLKKGTTTFHFNLNETFCNFLGPLGQYDHPWKKKHASLIFVLAKKKTTHFYRWELETSTAKFSSTLNLMVWFSSRFLEF